jgi:hypothetical protein
VDFQIRFSSLQSTDGATIPVAQLQAFRRRLELQKERQGAKFQAQAADVSLPYRLKKLINSDSG